MGVKKANQKENHNLFLGGSPNFDTSMVIYFMLAAGGLDLYLAFNFGWIGLCLPAIFQGRYP